MTEKLSGNSDIPRIAGGGDYLMPQYSDSTKRDVGGDLDHLVANIGSQMVIPCCLENSNPGPREHHGAMITGHFQLISRA